MNKLRKLGFLVLALVCALFVFASCKPEQEGPTAEEAAARISTTQDKQTIVSNFVVNNQVVLEGVTFTVTWESDNAVATVGTEKVDKDGKVAENGAFYLVTINYENNNSDQTVKLTATVANGEDKATKTITFTVPKFKTASFEEYAAAAKGDNLTVEGIVTGMNSKSRGDQDNSLYFNSLDNKGGFYAYSLASDPVTDGIKEGMTVKVSGKKDLYSGTYEIVDPTVTVIDQTIKTVTPVDLTDAYKAAEDLKAAELVGPQALLVTIKGVTITTAEESNGYYKFTLAGKESYIRVSSSNCPLDVEDTKTFKDEFAKHAGWIANATGIVSVYNGAFYLQPVSVDAFEYISLPELSDAEQVAFEKESLVLSTNKIVEAGDLTIDLAGKAYTGVNITWSSNSEQAVVNNETGKVAITLGEEKVTVKLTATLTKGEATATKEFEIEVSAVVKDVYVTTPITEPVAGTFIIVMDATALNSEKGKVYYFNGELNSKGALMTSTNIADAAEVVVEVVDGGYALKVGDKYLEGYLNVTYKNIRFADTAKVWKWNTEAKVFTFEIDGKDYYFGDRARGDNNDSVNDTMALSEIKYITGDNLVKVGVSQFPGFFGTIEYVAGTPVQPENPETGGDEGSSTPPTPEITEPTTTITVTQALDAAEGTVVKVEAQVKSVKDTSHGNFVITDGTKDIEIYGLYNASGVKYGEWTTGKDIAVGDTVVVYGLRGSYTGNYDGAQTTHQIQNAIFVSITKKPVDATLIAEYSFAKAMPTGLTSSGKTEWYADGGYKLNAANVTLTTAEFEAQAKVKVTLKVNTLNKKNTAATEQKTSFTICGLDASGNTVVTQTISSTAVVVGENVVILTGSGIVKVTVTFNDFPSNADNYLCNVSLGAILLNKVTE